MKYLVVCYLLIIIIISSSINCTSLGGKSACESAVGHWKTKKIPEELGAFKIYKEGDIFIFQGIGHSEFGFDYKAALSCENDKLVLKGIPFVGSAELTVLNNGESILFMGKNFSKQESNNPDKTSSDNKESANNNSNSSRQPIAKTQPREAPLDATTTKEPIDIAENQSIIDTYIGTIGEKAFKLFIEKVEGDIVEGYNVTGSNKRPVKGRIVNKWTKPTGLGGTYTIFKLILTEPGDDEWDGKFNIDLWISDQDRSGEGSWKSFNGKLVRDIKLKDRMNE